MNADVKLLGLADIQKRFDSLLMSTKEGKRYCVPPYDVRLSRQLKMHDQTSMQEDIIRLVICDGVWAR